MWRLKAPVRGGHHEEENALAKESEGPVPLLSIAEADELLRSDPVAAEARARDRLKSDPSDCHASYLLGAVLRRAGHSAEAKEILEPLTGRQPQLSSAWFELGMAFKALGECEPATAALMRALDLGWLDEESWYALGDLLPFGDSGNLPYSDYPQLDQAAAALHENHPEIAERILRDLPGAQPADARVMKLLADALIRLDRWSEARPLLERVLDSAPDYVAARFRYITMRCAQRDFDGLLPHADELLKADPRNLLYRALHALVLWWNGESFAAAAEFRTFIDACADRPGLWLQYARALRACRNEDAVAACRKALEILPSFVDAWVLLANMKTFRMDEARIEQMRILLDNPTLAATDRARLHFALGKAFEDLEQHAESFGHYRQCNEIFCAGRSSGIGASNRYLRDAKAFFTPAFFHARQGYGCTETGPIFIVGMPRAGSTLVEQILASHSRVRALGELRVLPETGQRLAPTRPGAAGGGYPHLLKDLDGAHFRQFGEEYLKAVGTRRASDRTYFTDKLPDNYNHVGLIHLILPNAKIIDMRRHPLDCCFSCFKHYFPGLQAMSLEDIGRAYANYVELMAHFDEVLPGKVHRVIYEELVTNPEAEIKRMLDHVGLPFEEQCLRFHESRNTVLTLSADQVNVPLYASAIGYWRKYERWLDPLKKGLGPVLQAYPSVPQFQPALARTPSVFLGLGRVSFGTASLPTAGNRGNPS